MSNEAEVPVIKVYAVMAGWSCDIMSEVGPVAYFSTQDKAETYILKENLLDRVSDGYSVYVEEILVDKEPE